MGKVRVLKIYEQREILTKTGKVLYVATSPSNLIVPEEQEYLFNLFSSFPIQPGEYEVMLHNLNLRIKEPKQFVPGVPGVSINSAKKPL